LGRFGDYCFKLTIKDLATYLVVSEGKITPVTEYVKNTIITPLTNNASLVANGNDFKTWKNRFQRGNVKFKLINKVTLSNIIITLSYIKNLTFQ